MKTLRALLIFTLAMGFSATLAFSQAQMRTLKASAKAPEEVLKDQQEAKRKLPKPPEGKLTRKGLEQRLQALPGEREKLEKVKKGFKPSASVIGEKGFSLSWLNPFSVSEAHAAVDLNLTNSNKFYSSSPYAYVIFKQVTRYYSYYYWYTVFMTQVGTYKPYAYLHFTAPSTGWYIINFRAWGTKAHINHYGSGTQGTVANWNFSSSKWNDFVTMQHLGAGGHYFYWYPDQYSVYVHSVQITSY
jgi:hypothetical protein